MTIPPSEEENRFPVREALPALKAALAQGNAAVLVAPPGAGKTTHVPLALLGEDWARQGKLVMLEPRRLAARAAARHMAATLGERPGETVGYRVRMDAKIGPKTRLEIVTEGVFTRMVLDDPALSGIAGVLFDEFHERSLDADFGLALALDVQSALRPDLRILPMSATIDGARVARLIGDAPVIESKGRLYPVEYRYQPKRPGETLEAVMVRAILGALRSDEGDLLCFLPGQGEIRRVAERLDDILDGPSRDRLLVSPLYGSLSPAAQDRAIARAPKGKRKIVLATSIAETSLTIDGVGVVIDSGLARVPRFEPGSGLTRLETVRASKAAIRQRAGRAGRLSPGIAIRLWQEAQTAALPDFETPEILASELSGLALDLAAWGVGDPGRLKWLDALPEPAWREAVNLLKTLGAVDKKGLITGHGKAMQKLPLPPRLAHMVRKGAQFGQAVDAARLAVLVTERGLGGADTDLASRLEKLRGGGGERAKKARSLAASIAGRARQSPPRGNGELSPGALLSFAWPDRIAKHTGENERGETLFQLANGRRGVIESSLPLARSPFIVVADLQGKPAAARIVSAAAIDEAEIAELHGERMDTEREILLDQQSGRFKARTITRLDRLRLAETATALTGQDDVGAHILAHIRENGMQTLVFSGKASALRDRLGFLHYHMPETFPDVTDTALFNMLEFWLQPFLTGASGFNDIDQNLLSDGLMLYAGYENRERIDRLAPARMTTPAGASHALRYADGKAILAVKVQELFGMTQHPTVLEGKLPVTLELLSPAMRPIQTTEDLPGFWRGSWRDVRAQMRGRYPKHFWPEDPAAAAPTTRAKPRGSPS